MSRWSGYRPGRRTAGGVAGGAALPGAPTAFAGLGRAVGTRLEFRGSHVAVHDLAGFDFAEVQLAIFIAGADVAAEFVPRAAAAGCAVVDTSSRFRAEPDVPLVIAAVNPQALDEFRERRIVATRGRRWCNC